MMQDYQVKCNRCSIYKTEFPAGFVFPFSCYVGFIRWKSCGLYCNFARNASSDIPVFDFSLVKLVYLQTERFDC